MFPGGRKTFNRKPQGTKQKSIFCLVRTKQHWTKQKSPAAQNQIRIGPKANKNCSPARRKPKEMPRAKATEPRPQY